MGKPKGTTPDLKYRRVEVAALDRGRRGKHHDLVQGILGELTTLSPGSAMEIPLADVGGIGLANLRSAVHRVLKGWKLRHWPTRRTSTFGKKPSRNRPNAVDSRLRGEP